MEDLEDHFMEDLEDHIMEDQEDHIMEDPTMDTKGEKLNLKIQVNLCQKLLFLQNMRRTCCVQKLF